MSASSASRPAWRILCIDDEPDIHEILSAVLGMEFEVLTAGDGLEGLGLLEFCEADFVICDIRMPNLDGYQTVEAIRRHPRFAEMPVFFLTAERSRAATRQGYKSGANLYLTKPFDPMRLLENVKYFLKEQKREPRAKKYSPDEALRRFRSLGGSRLSMAASAPEQLAPRVVVISPDEGLTSRVRQALAAGYEAVICADPFAALHQLFRYDPDILVIHPASAKLSGWGLMQLIRKNIAFRKLPIVVVQAPENPIDPRFVPSITSSPLLDAAVTPERLRSVIDDIAQSPEFQPRDKRTSLEELQKEEAILARAMAEEADRRNREQASLAERYQRVQEFIDHNME